MRLCNKNNIPVVTNELNTKEIYIYTDGSCHAQKRVGAWAAILLPGDKKIILQGAEANTTHNRMELLAVIKAIEYVGNNMDGDIVMQIVTDSQYVVGLPSRAGRLKGGNFITKKGTTLQNSDLVKKLYHLLENKLIHLNKIKAHQKKNGTINYNIMVDELVRNLMQGEAINYCSRK